VLQSAQQRAAAEVGCRDDVRDGADRVAGATLVGDRRQAPARRSPCFTRVHETATRTIVVCGALDVPIRLPRSAELARTLPNATYRSLSGRAHLPYLEATDEIAEPIMAEAE
jgi:pimeloyl-ACP methyl ester carboxylesterase